MLIQSQQLSKLINQDLYRLALEVLSECGPIVELTLDIDFLFVLCGKRRVLLVIDARSPDIPPTDSSPGNIRTFIRNSVTGVAAHSFAEGRLLVIRTGEREGSPTILCASRHNRQSETTKGTRAIHIFLTNGKYIAVAESSKREKPSPTTIQWLGGIGSGSQVDISPSLIPGVIPGSKLSGAVMVGQGVFVICSTSETALGPLRESEGQCPIMSVCVVRAAQGGDPELMEPRPVVSCLINGPMPQISLAPCWCYLWFKGTDPQNPGKILCVYARWKEGEGGLDVKDCIVTVPMVPIALFPGVTSRGGEGHVTLVTNNAELIDLTTSGGCKRLATAQFLVTNNANTRFCWFDDVLLVAKGIGKGVGLLAIHGASGVALESADILQRYSYSYGSEQEHKLISWASGITQGGLGLYWDDCSRLADAVVVSVSGGTRDLSLPVRLFSSDAFVPSKTLSPAVPFSRMAPLLTVAKRGAKRLRTIAALEGKTFVGADGHPSGLGRLSLRILRVLLAERRSQKALVVREALSAISDVAEAIRDACGELMAGYLEAERQATIIANRHVLAMALVDLVRVLLESVESLLAAFEPNRPAVVATRCLLSQEQVVGLANAIHVAVAEALGVKLLLDGEAGPGQGLVAASAVEVNVQLLGRVTEALESNMKGSTRGFMALVAGPQAAQPSTSASETSGSSEAQANVQPTEQSLVLAEVTERDPHVVFTAALRSLFGNQPFEKYLEDLALLSLEELTLAPPEVLAPILHVILPTLPAEGPVGTWAASVAGSAKEAGLRQLAWLVKGAAQLPRGPTLGSALTQGTAWGLGLAVARASLGETLVALGSDTEAVGSLERTLGQRVDGTWGVDVASRFPPLAGLVGRELRSGELLPRLVCACFYLHPLEVPAFVRAIYPLRPFTTGVTLRESTEMIGQAFCTTCIALARHTQVAGVVCETKLCEDPVVSAIRALGSVTLSRVRGADAPAALLDLTVARLLEQHTVGEGVFYLHTHGCPSAALFLAVGLSKMQQRASSDDATAATTNLAVLARAYRNREKRLLESARGCGHETHAAALAATGRTSPGDLVVLRHMPLLLADAARNPDNVMRHSRQMLLGFSQRVFGVGDVGRVLALRNGELSGPDFAIIKALAREVGVRGALQLLGNRQGLKIPVGVGASVTNSNNNNNNTVGEVRTVTVGDVIG